MVRYKHRYMTVEVNPYNETKNDSLSLKPSTLHDVVMKKIQQLHGDFGVAAVRTGFVAKYCNERTRIAILRARHGPHKIVASSLPFVNKIDSKLVSLRTLHIGATMKHTFKFIRKYQQAHLDGHWTGLKTEDERIAFQNAVMDFTKTDVQLDLEKMC